MENQIDIGNATSFSSGIVFYSKNYKGWSTAAKQLKNGKILVEHDENYDATTLVAIDVLANKTLASSVLTNIATVFLFATPCVLGAAVIYLLFSGLTHALGLILLGAACTGMLHVLCEAFSFRFVKNSYKLRQFHGAEHTVLNALRELQRVPTVEEVKQFSRLSSSCGINVTVSSVFTIFAWSACVLLASGLPLVAVAAMVASPFVINYATNAGWLNFFQYLTTEAPTDDELKVAVVGIREWYKREEYGD